MNPRLLSWHPGRARHALRIALLGHPVAPPSERHRPFFIIGSGRSGTTLTRAILQSHPDAYIPPETYVLGAAIGDFLRYRRLPWSALVRVVLGRFEFQKEHHDLGIRAGSLYWAMMDAPRDRRSLAFLLHSLYMHYAKQAKPMASRWGDKTPWNTFFLGRIRRVFPDARFIHLVRDGRDVVCSYLEMERYPTLREASARWISSVATARAFGEKWPPQYLELRYEDLVSDPEAQVKRLCTFLELDFSTSMLEHQRTQAGLADIEARPHLHNVRQPISTASIGKWRKRLSPTEADELNRLLGPWLARLGYS